MLEVLTQKKAGKEENKKKEKMWQIVRWRFNPSQIIALNRNYLNTPIKIEGLKDWINNKIQLDVVYIKATLNMKKDRG